MTLKTRAAWVKLHDKLEKQVATTEDELLNDDARRSEGF